MHALLIYRENIIYFLYAFTKMKTKASSKENAMPNANSSSVCQEIRAEVKGFISEQTFITHMQAGMDSVVGQVSDVAIALSGGPDSMALFYLLSHWAQKKNITLHALIVDHSLRANSQDEAMQVQKWAASLPFSKKCSINILAWEHDGCENKIQEQARQARYSLMAEYCAEHGIQHLFLAHHQNDQAETFLFRLAKGSGLDGLASMMPVQNLQAQLLLLRPLLDFEKNHLIATCENYNVSFVQDPSNDKEEFARVRLRKSWDVLEQEGLSAKRLSITAKRIARARHALEEIADMAFQDVAQLETDRIVLNEKIMRAWPGEIGLRIVMRAMQVLIQEEGYGPRMEKVERVFEELMIAKEFIRQTLGGIIFERNDKEGMIVLTKEAASSSL